MKAIEPLIRRVFEGKEGTEFAKSLHHFLIDGEGMQPIRRDHTAADKYKGLLFSGFAEISTSFYTLRDIEILIKSITTRPSKITKARLLSYHVHNYLNENYRLKSRLDQYPVSLLRASKRWSKNHRIIEPIREIVSSTFTNIVATRGRHVHDSRYTDYDLDRLSMLERIKETENESLVEPFTQLFRADFAVCRGRWLDRIRNNNDMIERLLDAYFTILYPLIFDNNGSIIIPAELLGV